MKVKKVLVSQPKPASEKSPYFDIAEKYGVNIEFRPFSKVEEITPKEFRQQKISILDYTAIIFTARTAIDHFFKLCEGLRVTIPETMKFLCDRIGSSLSAKIYRLPKKKNLFRKYRETGRSCSCLNKTFR